MSHVVRAKFFCSKVDAPEGATAATVTMGAVCRGVENAMWAQATPWANLSMGIKNDAAVPLFEQGEEYEVTFRKVAKPTLGDGHEIVEAVNNWGAIVCETCGMNLGVTQKAIDNRYGSAPAGVRDEARKLHDEHYGAAE
jgi:hypothetical protein